MPPVKILGYQYEVFILHSSTGRSWAEKRFMSVDDDVIEAYLDQCSRSRTAKPHYRMWRGLEGVRIGHRPATDPTGLKCARS